MDLNPPPPKSWSIHTRPEIIAKYEIQERVGSGAYSDVYMALRRSDNLEVALKEVHDYQSAFREIEALQILQGIPNVVVLHEHFWREDEDAVLVLEFLRTDLATVIKEAKKGGGLQVEEVKRWMMQILCGVDACHRNMIMHRDLKPGNMLISDNGVLKLADFGQARLLMEPGYVAADANQGSISKEEYFREMDELKAEISMDEIAKQTNVHDENTSCHATCTTSDIEEDPFKETCSYKAHEGEEDLRHGFLTSCVGTRWFRAPELLYGSTGYGLEVDLWSLGCIFAELLSLDPLFPGNSDIDQLGRIINVLGNLTENVWPGCAKLPDYRIISFFKVETPIGLEGCLPNRAPEEISLVKKLVCYNPAIRAAPMELLHDKYFVEEPLPTPISELRVPLSKSWQDEESPGEWYNYNDSDSDFDEFGPPKVTTTHSGFSIQFP